ncbi:snRNA-activating protein complex subunit 4 [Bagarius yarrelli]|uniref:snRNA-activating protein complex subunit 4 n=1 Tax=Bagarius yarrelli TaxID=175774 RepID=A0A556U5H9_BAGYA|nr:snRNA-activating protein complex subunit 4 [Bagarius yarrelli]
MSKHKTSQKKLIIEDDEAKDDEELNPFSFKEFIRSKTQHPSTTDSVEKTFDGVRCSVEDDYQYTSGFQAGPKGPFFTDPSLLEQSFDCKPEDEWTESYQPSGIDQTHDLGLNVVLDNSAYFSRSLLSCEDEDESVNEWELREGFSPRHDLHRRSTGSYEGDDEPSVVDRSFQGKISAENGINYQEKLREENSQLRKHVRELRKKSEADSAKIRELTDELHSRNLQEEREAKALESMVQSVEENLQLMTNGEDSDEDLDLPQDLETCLQMNLVYQEVLKEKLSDLERLLKENREQQKDLEEQLSGPSSTSAGVPHQRLFLGNFMKPYFKDKLTALGPPANEETKERLANGTKPCDERKIKRWEPWQKTLLIKSVVTDTMKRMLQPKLSKSLREDQLYGARHDYHDWDKIANTDFECFRQPDDLMRFWQNYLHPSINKSTWSQDEIGKLADVAEQHMNCHWEQIAESLGTNRTAFMCFQTYQRYISKRFKKREWNNEEDQLLRELVEKMRIGNFIPYTQISYFMEGRDNSQLIYRWTCVLDPSLKKGPWTKEEDELLLKAVKKYGCKEWWKIKLEVPGRTDNACRDRYLDCLQDDVKKGAWSDEEVELLKKLVEKYGVGKWSKIAAEIPNRLDCQCLHKWKWMQKVARKGIKRGRGRSVNREPEMKRRCMKQTNLRKVKTESDASGDEEKITYTDSDAEQPVKNVCVHPVEDCTREYVQPDMKKWIPVRGNMLAHSSVNVNTTLVRLPTEAEESGTDRVRNTVLDKLGNPVKTYVGMEPPALQNPNLIDEHTMIMVSEYDVKHLLICMRKSLFKARSSKIQTRLASCTNQNITKNDQKEEKQKAESGKRRRPALAVTQKSYDLMLAITPWVGNVIMHIPFSGKRVCEADIVQKRAADVPLLKSPVFLLFLQALKVDADGCKKVIESRKGNVSLVTCIYMSYIVLIAQRNKNRKQSTLLQFPEMFYSHLLPQSAKIAIPTLPQQQRKKKQATRKAVKPASQAAVKPASQAAVKPASQAAVKPASQAAVKPASQAAVKPASRGPSGGQGA